jgi:heat shock protein HslJ
VSAFGQAERLGTRQWKLVQLDGANVAATSKAYLELDPEQTRFTGNTGCNRMFGSVTVQGRRIDFLNVGTTKMACLDPRVQRVETRFVNALQKVDRFRRQGDSLELYDRNLVVARLRAVTKELPDDSDELSRLKWTLEAIRGVPVAKVGQTAFLVFDQKKGSAGGNSSCNVFGGNYTVQGKTLKITDVVSTMRACVEDKRMNVEREFLDGLRETNRYEIQRGRLLLYRNQRLLLTLRGERK